MKNTILLIVCTVFFYLNGISQKHEAEVGNDKQSDKEEVFTIVEQMPEFSGAPNSSPSSE